MKGLLLFMFAILSMILEIMAAPLPTLIDLLTSKSPFYAKKMEDRKEKVSKAEKAQQRAHIEHLRYLEAYQDAHNHVKVGNKNRDEWIEFNKQKQNSDSQGRRHTIIANSMKPTLPGISQPMQDRANHFKKNSDHIQTQMDKLSKHNHYDYDQAEKQIKAHLARQGAHDHIMAGYENTIRKNSRPWPF